MPGILQVELFDVQVEIHGTKYHRGRGNKSCDRLDATYYKDHIESIATPGFQKCRRKCRLECVGAQFVDLALIPLTEHCGAEQKIADPRIRLHNCGRGHCRCTSSMSNEEHP